MREQKYPPGWNESRVQRLIDHYENMSDDEMLAEDEAARAAGESHLVVLPAVPKTNGKIAVKGARPKKKRTKQSKMAPRSKQRKGKTTGA